MDTDMFSDTAGKSCLHKIFCFRNTETRAVYHIAQGCECNMIYCKGQYSSILVQ